VRKSKGLASSLPRTSEFGSHLQSIGAKGKSRVPHRGASHSPPTLLVAHSLTLTSIWAEMLRRELNHSVTQIYLVLSSARFRDSDTPFGLEKLFLQFSLALSCFYPFSPKSTRASWTSTRTSHETSSVPFLVLIMSEKIKETVLEETEYVKLLAKDAARSGAYLYPFRVRNSIHAWRVTHNLRLAARE
jgi:hypothetical protein